jgi:hypothetical protein
VQNENSSILMTKVAVYENIEELGIDNPGMDIEA